MVVESLANQLLNLLIVGFALFADDKLLGAFRVCRHDTLRP